MNKLKVSDKGIKFLKEREGEVLYGYLDSVGLLTIGVGHLVKKGEPYKLGQKITQAESTRLLKEDIAEFEGCVNSAINVTLNQNQFDALVSLAFNIGQAGFKRSSVVKKANAKNFQGAADSILAWNKAGGKVAKGLVTRRELERKLFLTPYKAIKLKSEPVTESQIDDTISTEDKPEDQGTNQPIANVEGDINIDNTQKPPVPSDEKPVELKKETPSFFVKMWTGIVAAVGAITSIGISAETLINRALENITLNQIVFLAISLGLVWLAFWLYSKSADRANKLNQKLIDKASDQSSYTVSLVSKK